MRIAKLYCFWLLLYASQTLLPGHPHVWIWVPVVEFGWAQNISILCQIVPSENAFCPRVERVRSYLPPFLAPLTQLHGWWHLFAGRSILPFLNMLHHWKQLPSLTFLQNAIAGYATYMNIQFCLFHRLSFLKLSPRYTSDLMGVAVQVWRVEVKRWSVILAGDQVCIGLAHLSPCDSLHASPAEMNRNSGRCLDGIYLAVMLNPHFENHTFMFFFSLSFRCIMCIHKRGHHKQIFSCLYTYYFLNLAMIRDALYISLT